MNVLIVDDNETSVKGIRNYCTEKGWIAEIRSFENFEKVLQESDSDVVVLDWKDDPTGELKGEEVVKLIWTRNFKPIVIFSAYASIIELDDMLVSSNLIKVYPKGDETVVTNYLDFIFPFVNVISGLKNEFNDALIKALNSIEMMSKASPISDDVKHYVFAKRASNYFDVKTDGTPLPAWIQYTYPPMTNSLCVCDIIRKVSPQVTASKIEIAGSADEYRLILTPSCDLAFGKVANVLCARCDQKDRFHGLSLVDLSHGTPDEQDIGEIKSHLHTGYKNKWVPLPSIPGTMPYLSVNLKRVELIPFENIVIDKNLITSESEYYRVASIDSPFREQIVWAHMINSCRPGVPDRDVEKWAEDLITK